MFVQLNSKVVANVVQVSKLQHGHLYQVLPLVSGNRCWHLLFIFLKRHICYIKPNCSTNPFLLSLTNACAKPQGSSMLPVPGLGQVLKKSSGKQQKLWKCFGLRSKNGFGVWTFCFCSFASCCFDSLAARACPAVSPNKFKKHTHTPAGRYPTPSKGTLDTRFWPAKYCWSPFFSGVPISR